MTMRARAVACGAAAVMVLGSLGTGSVAAAESGVAAKTNPKYLVCNPAKWPGANPKYPFSFLLSTKYQHTRNAHIRAAVRSIQTTINTRVWGNQLTAKKPVHVTVDGSYGPKTAAAVRKFQAATGIVVDGKVGKQTWKTLASYCGSD